LESCGYYGKPTNRISQWIQYTVLLPTLKGERA